MQYWQGNDKSQSQSKRKDDNFQTLSFIISCSINLSVSYVDFAGLLPALIFHKTVSIFCILFFRVWFVWQSSLLWFWKYLEDKLYGYSFEPLCHKPCCHRYPSGISQSSVLSTNIQSVCFQKSLLYRPNQWKVVHKALYWVEFIDENCLEHQFKLNQCSYLHEPYTYKQM